MKLQTISEVSKQFNISTRTLRYYEQIGLIQPVKKEDFSYRSYDENTVLRLKQIIVLRKLRIPLKQISDILQSDNAAVAIEAFQQNLSGIEDEITALATIKSLIQSLIERLNIVNVNWQILDDVSLLEIVDSLTVSKINFKEDRAMEDLNKANEKLNKLTDKDVRIMYLPPMTVAAFHSLGSMAELDGAIPIREFINRNRLFEVYPELRHFGFNHPNGKMPDMSDHGYERWITIPSGMEVDTPFIKKHFPGGLYAAHMIPMGAFEEWHWLLEWANNNKKYETNLVDDEGECMHGLLEEHLNFKNMYMLPGDSPNYQIDLLLPIKERT